MKYELRNLCSGIVAAALFAGVASLAPTDAGAAVLVLTPTTAQRGAIDLNGDGSGGWDLASGNKRNLMRVGNTAIGGERRLSRAYSAFEFDVPAGEEVVSAILTVNAAQFEFQAGTEMEVVYLDTAETRFNNAQANNIFFTAGTSQGVVFDSTNANGDSVDIDITASILADVADGSDVGTGPGGTITGEVYALLLYKLVDDITTTSSLDTAPNQNVRVDLPEPTLTITTAPIPEPSSVVLAAAGGLLMIGRRRAIR
ncbi:MAG: hypothetical protein AAF662_05335 [Pseudomonadota bacterium]